jgi:CRP/FNR family cyclic AMP-dependent transcriptional regulator
MAKFGKEETPEPVIAKVSQQTLAEMVGTTRARVNTFMNKFRKLGFVEYNGNMKIHPSLLNVVLHNQRSPPLKWWYCFEHPIHPTVCCFDTRP